MLRPVFVIGHAQNGSGQRLEAFVAFFSLDRGKLLQLVGIAQ